MYLPQIRLGYLTVGRLFEVGEFRDKFKPKSAFIVGDGGISAEEFLSMDIRTLFK
jgi:hypothetical protein